jgi:hypothetical protein
VIKLSDCKSGARVIACDVVATAKAKPTRAISLIILFLPSKTLQIFPQRAKGRGNPAGAPLHPATSTTVDLCQRLPFGLGLVDRSWLFFYNRCGDFLLMELNGNLQMFCNGFCALIYVNTNLAMRAYYFFVGTWVANLGEHNVENSSCWRDCALRWHSLYNSVLA